MFGNGDNDIVISDPSLCILLQLQYAQMGESMEEESLGGASSPTQLVEEPKTNGALVSENGEQQALFDEPKYYKGNLAACFILLIIVSHVYKIN